MNRSFYEQVRKAFYEDGWWDGINPPSLVFAAETQGPTVVLPWVGDTGLYSSAVAKQMGLDLADLAANGDTDSLDALLRTIDGVRKRGLKQSTLYVSDVREEQSGHHSLFKAEVLLVEVLSDVKIESIGLHVGEGNGYPIEVIK